MTEFKEISHIFHDLSIYNLKEIANFAYTDPSHKIIYIPIRKNACSAISWSLMRSGWRLIKDSKIIDLDKFYNEAIFFSVLRDPYQRYLSGLNTYLRVKAIEFPPIDKILEQKQFEDLLYISIYYNKSFSFDDHTCLQKTYFQDPILKDKEITYFQLHPRLGYQLNQWLYSHEISNTLNDNVINPTDKTNKLYKTINEFFLDAKNHKYKKYLLEYLSDDYEYLESITFYG